MELVIQQRQELGVLMTLELRQAIELLQYSTYELEQYLRQQELENPLIELKEPDLKTTYKEVAPYRIASFQSTERQADVQCFQKSMQDVLIEQAKLTFSNSRKQQLVLELIYHLNDYGYLVLENQNELFYNEQEMEEGIHLLQQIGPLGIGARNLKECLLLQITYAPVCNPLAYILVENHLELVANRKWEEISACMGITMFQVKELYEYVKTLNPRPCSSIEKGTSEYWTPDIIVEKQEGRFVFHLNDTYLPKLHLHADYVPYLQQKGEVSQYMRSHYKNYQWLLNSIEERRNTIIKIVKVLLEKQEDFFRNGPDALHPLTLKEVADEIDMHESTVSRATANKVIQTPFGSFELRRLFTSKLNTADGNSISQAKVKALLQIFVNEEDKLKPYSDQKIAEYFNTEKGISISRRTISKYREELRIPPSSKRKDIKV